MTITIIRPIAAALFAAIVLLGSVPCLAEAPRWLLGKWEMTHDPDGDEKDWIEFRPNGTVISMATKGEDIFGTYVIDGSEIRLTVTYGGRTRIIPMTVDEKKQVLFVHSKKTGNSSEYRKVKARGDG